MPQWLQTHYQAILAGDLATIIITVVSLLVIFLIMKLLMSTLKAVIIVVIALLAITVLMPDAKVLEKAQQVSKEAAEFVQENVDTTQILKQAIE